MMRRVVLVLCVAMLPVAFGCGGDGLKLSKATGKVTYKNQPLQGANIKFYPSTGPAAVAITDDNGMFSMNTSGRAGAMVGLNRVTVTKMTAGTTGVQPSSTMTPDDMKNMAKSNIKKENTGPKSVIPEKYGDPDSGLLTAEVSADSSQNDFVFDLQ
jgi:hypothetical protein